MIDVQNLTKIYKTDQSKEFKACDNISFHVDKAEIFGIIGLSGAGKSTLIRCLNRLEEPSDGKISINDVDITSLSKADLLKERQKIGMIFQHFNLFQQKTVYKNISYPLEIANYDKEKIHERTEELLRFVDLYSKRNAYPSQISGGQKQRVAIARALALNPQILLSDEGTSALDPENTRQIIQLLKRTVKTYGTTIVMITHQMEVAKDICDRIAVMENGKIIEENTVEELFKNPKTERTKSFIRTLSEANSDELFDPTDYKGTLVKITYSQDSFKHPILSQVIKQTEIDVNIVSGNINRMQEIGVGYTIAELIGAKEKIRQAMNLFEEYAVKIEVIR